MSETFTCLYCNRDFPRKWNCEKHMNTNCKLNLDGEITKLDALKRKKWTRKSHPCKHEDCNVSFSSLKNLNNHIDNKHMRGKYEDESVMTVKEIVTRLECELVEMTTLLRRKYENYKLVPEGSKKKSLKIKLEAFVSEWNDLKDATQLARMDVR